MEKDQSRNNILIMLIFHSKLTKESSVCQSTTQLLVGIWQADLVQAGQKPDLAGLAKNTLLQDSLRGIDSFFASLFNLREVIHVEPA